MNSNPVAHPGLRFTAIIRIVVLPFVMLVSVSIPAQGITQYSGASIGSGGLINGWGVTDAYQGGMAHIAYVTTTLTSPNGRVANSGQWSSYDWVRADVFLPFAENDLGLYLVNSQHSYFCYYLLMLIQLISTQGSKRVYDFSITVLPSEIRPQGIGGTYQTTVTVQMFPSPYEARAVSLQDVRLNGATYGGHESNHPTTFPTGTGGTFSPVSGNTSSSTGKFTSTYTARIFAGEHQIKATMDGRTKTAPINLRVKISGFQQLTDGANFDLIGSTPNHILPNNHFGTPNTNSNLQTLANQYSAQYPGSILRYNDQSLPWGGLFDIGPTQNCPTCVFWQSPHSDHREGVECDVDDTNVDQTRWATLENLFRNNGFPGFIPEHDKNHWHLQP